MDLEIPSVLYSAANVFQSPEAIELEYILAAVSEPGNEKLIKAALTTDTLGLTGNELDTLVLDDRAWDAKLIQFQKYHQLWSEKGFIQMLRTLLLEQGVRARLLGYPSRRATSDEHPSSLRAPARDVCGARSRNDGHAQTLLPNRLKTRIPRARSSMNSGWRATKKPCAS